MAASFDNIEINKESDTDEGSQIRPSLTLEYNNIELGLKTFADIQLLAEEELAILKEASYTAVISRLGIHRINIDTTLEDLEAPPLSEEDVESDT
ncbi:hypothetical protein QYM36_018943 [Artemia franciscana]|uniref:Uncharacterized protein n=1 Tax=Artemia franciscana TaxID=6661 RepID=A0AA88H1S4_ARTSF|nr:hypothetical protein QYM36_018943 [Artemia franciscana]